MYIVYIYPEPEFQLHKGRTSFVLYGITSPYKNAWNIVDNDILNK